MKRIKNNTTLLNKYSLMYEKKPRSRVFAPLAEAYRKLGMIDEAMKILSQGIRNHPSYTLGYTVLANCYFDLKNYEMAYNTIRPFVSQNLENITLQKLFANTCINLGHLDEALQTFKYLLLINPKDMYVAEQIKLLEDDLLVEVDEQIESKTSNNSSSFDEDEWVQVSFTNKEEKEEEDLVENWNVEKDSPLDNFKNEVKQKSIELKHHDLNDEFFHEDYDNEDDDVIAPANKSNVPIISHTLVDLYCNQGHLDKAASVLENILDLHPDDEPTRKRLDEITLMMVNENIPSDTSEITLDNENEKLARLRGYLEQFEKRVKEVSQMKLAVL